MFRWLYWHNRYFALSNIAKLEKIGKYHHTVLTHTLHSTPKMTGKKSHSKLTPTLALAELAITVAAAAIFTYGYFNYYKQLIDVPNYTALSGNSNQSIGFLTIRYFVF